MSKAHNKTRRKKQEETKRRFDAIKDLMSTFAMSTVAVVAVVTLIPSSPKAEITRAISLTNEIVYQVNVTDEDNALDLETLVVVLENQLEYYEKPIQLGEQSGYFDSLENNTEYRLSVYGSKGFGQERLDTVIVSTKEQEGGTILSVTPQNVQFESSYLVDVSVVDPDSKYTSIDLYYGFSWEPGAPLQYSSVSITQARDTIELWDIPSSYEFHVYLEGTTVDGTETLDEIWVTPPYHFQASVYMDYMNQHEIGFYVYSDTHIGENQSTDVSYKMHIYRNEILLETKQITMSDDHYEGGAFVIDGLSPNTTYEFECVAIYKNPQTLRTEEAVVYFEEITTLSSYNYSYTSEIVGEFIEFTITLIDSNNYFDIAYYEIYDISDNQSVYIDSQAVTIIDTGTEKIVTLSILTPSVTAYEIEIGMRDTNYTINQIIETIIEE